MNTHSTDTDVTVRIFSSDVIRAENQRKARRKNLLMALAASVIAIGVSCFTYQALASLRHAMTPHVHYIDVSNSDFGAQKANFPFMPVMPVGLVEANGDFNFAQTRMEKAQAELHETARRFRTEQEAFRQKLATDQVGTVLFAGPTDSTQADSAFVRALADGFGSASWNGGVP